jgi:cytochrome c-type biogenesis protein CcmH/NrfG
MTLFSTAQPLARDSRRGARSHLAPIMLAGVVTAGAITLVAYLLWPTWSTEAFSSPARLPVSIDGTLFNVPTMAVRMKIQRHSGPQERVDLSFAFPSLEPVEAPKHVSVGTVDIGAP